MREPFLRALRSLRSSSQTWRACARTNHGFDVKKTNAGPTFWSRSHRMTAVAVNSAPLSLRLWAGRSATLPLLSKEHRANTALFSARAQALAPPALIRQLQSDSPPSRCRGLASRERKRGGFVLVPQPHRCWPRGRPCRNREQIGALPQCPCRRDSWSPLRRGAERVEGSRRQAPQNRYSHAPLTADRSELSKPQLAHPVFAAPAGSIARIRTENLQHARSPSAQ